MSISLASVLTDLRAHMALEPEDIAERANVPLSVLWDLEHGQSVDVVTTEEVLMAYAVLGGTFIQKLWLHAAVDLHRIYAGDEWPEPGVSQFLPRHSPVAVLKDFKLELRD